MNITFKSSNNGSCPQFVHNNIKFYIIEENDEFGEWSWVLKSKRIGFSKRQVKTDPYKLLRRFFKNKTYGTYNKPAYQIYKSGDYILYYWRGKIIATDGKVITIQYEEKYERPYFETYLECLEDAKQHILNNYFNKQLSLI